MRKGNHMPPEIRIKQDPLSRPIRALFIPPPSDLLQQQGQIILKDGTVAEVRIAHPSDAGTLRLFVDRLSPESKRHRFFSATRPPAEVYPVTLRFVRSPCPDDTHRTSCVGRALDDRCRRHLYRTRCGTPLKCRWQWTTRCTVRAWGQFSWNIWPSWLSDRALPNSGPSRTPTIWRCARSFANPAFPGMNILKEGTLKSNCRSRPLTGR